MGGEFRGERTHDYIWLSSCAGYLKPPQRFLSAIPQDKVKRLKFGGEEKEKIKPFSCD